MKMTITDADARRDHPGAVVECIKQMCSSKAKTARTVPLLQWEWRYSWVERIDGSVRPGSPEEEIQRRVDNSGVRLDLFHGRCCFSVSIEVPAKIIDKIRSGIEAQEAERVRVDALSPDDRQAEIEGLLGELAGPGFVAFGRSDNPIMQAAKRAGVRTIHPKE